MISIKKLATVGAAAGLLAASAMPVFASHSDDLDIDQKNGAIVKNNTVTVANTGLNSIGGGKLVIQKTGNALAQADVSTVANKNVAVVKDCDCFDDVDIDQKNFAYVKNNTVTVANSGKNTIGGGKLVIQKTGNATAVAWVTNVVNKNVTVVGD